MAPFGIRSFFCHLVLHEVTKSQNRNKTVMGRSEPNLAWTILNLLVGSLSNGKVSHFIALMPALEDHMLPFVDYNHHLILHNGS
jgi:hypothetical protein